MFNSSGAVVQNYQLRHFRHCFSTNFNTSRIDNCNVNLFRHLLEIIKNKRAL